MNLKIESYVEQVSRWPLEGRHIMAQFDAGTVVVYQAYRPSIGRLAAERGHFRGSGFNFGRMSWIKPNFLWMMYRCGWAIKPDQEVVLAVRIRRAGFEAILRQAVPSTFAAELHHNESDWRDRLRASSVRLQWDPDHGPRGEKLARRAIQLGLRGELLRQYDEEWIESIEDISDFVRDQHAALEKSGIEGLMSPRENIYPLDDPNLRKTLGLDLP